MNLMIPSIQGRQWAVLLIDYHLRDILLLIHLFPLIVTDDVVVVTDLLDSFQVKNESGIQWLH